VAIVVIGGHSRSVGKTSVVAGLIAALREHSWTAIKITQYGHGVCSANGAPCDCATADHAWAISEEKDRTGESDTSRFLLAGAKRSLWVRTEQGRLAEAMPALRQRIEKSHYVIIESNSVLKFLRPDLYLTVLDPETQDFKSSAQEFLDRADAVILHEHAKGERTAWQSVSLKPVAERPVFRIAPPDYVTPEIVEFVRNILLAVERKNPASSTEDKLARAQARPE
jgi:molybdopterin-guanine dinucleotide biosynthesis protein